MRVAVVGYGKMGREVAAVLRDRSHEPVMTLRGSDFPAGCPVDVQAVRSKLVDAIVEADEALMEKYLLEGAVTTDELKTALPTALAAGTGPTGGPLWDSGTCAPPDGHAAGTSPGCPYSVTFAAPGSYNYFCVYHGGAKANNPVTKMNGVIIVTGTPSTRPGGGRPVVGTGVAPDDGAGLASPQLFRERRRRWNGDESDPTAEFLW